MVWYNIFTPDAVKTVMLNSFQHQYEDITNKLLNMAKKCGAENLHETMKTTFDLMLETAKKNQIN